jgi:hypothetical protein
MFFLAKVVMIGIYRIIRLTGLQTGMDQHSQDEWMNRIIEFAGFCRRSPVHPPINWDNWEIND